MSEDRLIKLKAKLKTELSRSPKSVIEQLLGSIDDKSDLYNQVLVLKSQIRGLENDEINGILNEEARAVRQNKINNNILKNIDLIQNQDLLRIDLNDHKIRLVFDFVEEKTKLESELTNLRVKNDYLEQQVDILQNEIKEYKNEIKKLEHKIGLKKQSPILAKINEFNEAYKDTLEFYPKIHLIFSKIGKEKFFDEKIAQELLKLFSNGLLRELEYSRYFMLEIAEELFSLTNGLFGENNKKLRDEYNKLNVFRRSLTTDLTEEDVEYFHDEAEKLLENVHNEMA